MKSDPATQTAALEHETLGVCPICKSERSSHFHTCVDHTVSGESFDIRECEECGFRYTDPRPLEDRIGDYYEAEEYISHSNTKKGLINTLYHWARQYTVWKKERLVRQLASDLPKKILDHGCGTGEFLAQCRKKGWETQGLEPDDGAREQAAQLLGHPVHSPETLSEFPDDSLSIITLWHVLEHVPRLEETVGELKRTLSSGGTLVVAVPNCRAYDAAHYKENWAAYDLPRHLYHFRPPDIRRLFEDHGMEVVRVRPMLLDAIYVSMMSEKYMGNSPLKGVLHGVRSNLRANLQNEAYSAQTYIIRHREEG